MWPLRKSRPRFRLFGSFWRIKAGHESIQKIELLSKGYPALRATTSYGTQQGDAIVVLIVITPLLRTQRDAVDEQALASRFLVREAGGANEQPIETSHLAAIEGIDENLGAGGPAA